MFGPLELTKSNLRTGHRMRYLTRAQRRRRCSPHRLREAWCLFTFQVRLLMPRHGLPPMLTSPFPIKFQVPSPTHPL